MAGKGREGGGLNKKGCFAIYFSLFGVNLSFQSDADFSRAVVALSLRHQGKHIGGGTKKKSMSVFFLFVKI